MKTVSKYFHLGGLMLFAWCAFALWRPAQAQKSISPRLDLAFYQWNDTAMHLRINVRHRVDRRFYPVPNATVRISMELPDKQVDVGTVVTDEKGEAETTLAGALVRAMQDIEAYSFEGIVLGNDSIEEVVEALFVVPSRLRMETDNSDSTIRITLETRKEGEWNAMPDTDLSVFVKRRFGRIRIGDEFYTTDEDGAVTVPFEMMIPGDQEGGLLLECAVEDHDELGNVYATNEVPWGTPRTVGDRFSQRTLWSTRDKTPWWLLIVPNAIIAGVWGVILYLIVTLLKIRKLSGEET